MPFSRGRAARACGALVLAGGVLAGCGSASAPSPPTGVDQLLIPTPSPEAADFVAEVSNQWLPLTPGTVWSYDDGTVLSVEEGVDHGGVRTTVLVTTPGADPAAVVRDHVVEDQDANLWLFGRQQAGEGEVTWFDSPGLVLPAEPRFGDGWTVADAPGLSIRAEVDEVGDRVEVPLGDYGDVVDVVVTTDEVVATQVALAPGVGPVRLDDAGLVEVVTP